ncbi:Extended synaptotagmin-2 [Trichinella nativa]|uniref:Dimethyladenosine transferase 1, mitochondrial n=1 Tax=Trichinella nativa TaxID=6335 RepID=A0A0V1KZZ7_9BILA|nr:Extended synaptotagmin-2 [Trichinella nativa]
MPKGKLFSTGGLWKPKNQHSLEYLKYLCDLLTKNAIVTEQNRALLVEALRLISEILIWGDQNDSSVFDFFLEKNMLSFFLFIMRQKCGRFVCIQLLQTLNILFENIRNETSLYYLLSNNHVNSIITYRFDFSDEEILAYYISFLKTLSFKLNVNTVHFFFNEICICKYLHVCVLVNDPQVIRFIRDNTAVPYFSNLVWFIRQRANEINGSGVDRMRDLIADHQDHIHYLNDILCLDVEDLNKVLIDQLMSKLFLPVYLNSIYAIPDINDERPFSLLVTVFFLTQSGSCSVGNYATPILQLILRSHDEDCPVRIATLELCCTYITQLFHSSKMHSRVILEMIPRLKHCRHLIEQKLIPCIEAFDTFIELFEDEATAFMLIRSWFILSKLLTNLRAESLELEKTMQPVLSVKEGDCMNLGKFFFLLTRCCQTVICWLVQLYTTTIGNAQLYFVEPDSSKVGWGVVRFVGQLQGCSQSRKYRLVAICDLLHVKVPEPAGPLPSRVFHNLTTGSKVELSPTNSSNEEPKKQDDIDGVVEEMRCIDLGQSPKPAKLLFSQKFNTTIANAAEVTEYCQEQPGSSIAAPLPDHLKPTCMIVLGMAGSGKSTLVQRICAYLSATKTSLYPVNLDPAVHYVSYPTAVVFTWSASGAIISQALASSFPTVIVYVMDVARSSSPITFTSNMLYACSIMYKTQLPMVVAMNKTDIISANFALDWINDFECFLEALDSETSFAGDLTRRLALGLEEFYKTLKCTGVSAISGEGMKRFFELIDQARLEYETDYKPELEQRKLQLDKKKIEKQAERLNRLKLDIASDPPQSHIASLRENFFGDQFCFGGLQDDDSAEDEEYEKPSSSGVEPIPRPSAPDRASSRWFPFVYGDKTEMRGETSDDSYSSSVGSALLVLVCWTIGRSDCSIFWILALLGLVLLRNHLLRQRSRRIRAHQVTALQEKEVIVTQLKDLPTWVQFPDVERVEWINRVIAQTWPGIANFAKDFLKENIEPQIKDNLPSVFRSFCFESIDIGDIPVRVGGIKVYAENVGRDRIVMDMDVAYAGDCSLSVRVGCFRAGVEQLQFQGKLRCILRPLISKPPWFGGFVIFFLNEPAFEFDLTGAGELVEMPGLMRAMRSVISSQLANICVLPNEIVIPVVPETKMCDLSMSEPQGVVRVGVIAATNLENKDSFLKGKSDPYVRITVGGQIYQTKTIENNLNPVWNEEFDAIVDHADGQYLGVELYDEDPGSRDEFLGNLDLDMDSVRNKGYISDWYALNAVKHGNVNLSVHWMNLSSDASLLDDVQNLPHSVPSSGPRNHALLMIYVDCIKNLPSVRKSFEPSPFILLTFGNEQRKTSVKMKTNNPVYQQRFVFLVKNVHHDILKLEAKDKTSGRSLGEVAIPVRLLKEENNMELKQQTWHMALGPHLSPITMTLKLRLVRTAGNLEGNYVCEVGPGPGGITRAILEQNPKKLVVVEKDPRFLPTLELIAESTGGIMDIRIGDVMKYEIETEFPADVKREWSEEPPPVHVIGNLPFNVSTYLIIKWLRAMSLHEGPFAYGRTLLTLTFQKEVGERMLAPIFNRHRCRLSVMCQYLSDVKRKFTIPGRACVPSPDVDVAVMQFRPKVTPVISHHFDLVEKFCRHLFHYRNKYCIRGIETLFPDFLKKDFSHEILRFARVSPKLAPPALAIEEIRDMCKIYEEQCLRVPSLFYYDYRQRKDFEEVQRNCPAEPPLLKHLSSNVETFSERL